VNIPFFKPRFVLTDTGTILLPLPSKATFDRMLESADLLDSLKTSDGCYDRFVEFKHFGMTPLASSAWFVFTKARNLKQLIDGEDSFSPLAKELIQRMQTAVAMHNAAVVHRSSRVKASLSILLAGLTAGQL
jgi:hypothetical protein